MCHTTAPILFFFLYPPTQTSGEKGDAWKFSELSRLGKNAINKPQGNIAKSTNRRFPPLLTHKLMRGKLELTSSDFLTNQTRRTVSIDEEKTTSLKGRK